MLSTRKSICLALCFFLGLTVASVRCAEEKDSKSSKKETSSCFDRINTWVDGVVETVNANDGQFTLKGVKLPFASAHAELRSEYAKRVANADAAKKQEIAEELSKKWQDKLEKAKTEKESEAPTEFNLKSPANGDLVFLVRRSAQDMAFVSSEEDPSQPNGMKISGELVSIDVYEVPNAAKPGEAHAVSAPPTLKELKAGDHIKVGFDSSSNEACAIIRTHEQKDDTKKNAAQ